MNKEKLVNIILSLSLFFMVTVSLLSLQNNDIKISQTQVSVKLDLRDKFNLNLALESAILK